MKHFRYASALLLMILTRYAYADGVSTLLAQANIHFGTNFAGDNQSSTFGGAGLNLYASGDVSCSWCGSGNLSLTPGSWLAPNVGIGGIDFVYVAGVITLNGQTLSCDEHCQLGASGIAALSGFVFPTNDRDFTVTVPARLTTAIIGAVGSDRFALQVPQGELRLTFDFIPTAGARGYYQLERGVFTTTPEPGTLGLVGSGLAGVLGALLKKHRAATHQHRSTTLRAPAARNP